MSAVETRGKKPAPRLNKSVALLVQNELKLYTEIGTGNTTPARFWASRPNFSGEKWWHARVTATVLEGKDSPFLETDLDTLPALIREYNLGGYFAKDNDDKDGIIKYLHTKFPGYPFHFNVRATSMRVLNRALYEKQVNLEPAQPKEKLVEVKQNVEQVVNPLGGIFIPNKTLFKSLENVDLPEHLYDQLFSFAMENSPSLITVRVTPAVTSGLMVHLHSSYNEASISFSADTIESVCSRLSAFLELLDLDSFMLNRAKVVNKAKEEYTAYLLDELSKEETRLNLATIFVGT